MRPSATVVVTPRGPWGALRSCLEQLRPTLGVRDRVVLVDPGTDPGTTKELSSRSWLTVVRSSTGGPSAGVELAVSDPARDVVVLLDGDTLVTSHWLDALLAPLQDPSVVATGPRTNYARGPQALGVPYSSGRTTDVARVARDRRQAHRNGRTDVVLLEGFAVAVRRADLEAIGGLDPALSAGPHDGADLSLALTADGRRLVVCEDAFVHRTGWAEDGGEAQWLERRRADRQRLMGKYGARADVVPKDVLLSACMIVKDEEDRLPECLASLKDLVDEVVVYDTGSTDGTRELAREAGAVVLEGYWDDDFSRARNEALARCSGQWVLHVDADESAVGDAASVRADLAARTAEDAVHVQIHNVDDRGAVGFSHEATRLFRRRRAHWAGRLHEQVVPVAGALLRQPRSATPLELVHTGYTATAMRDKDKANRNLRVAQQDVAEQGEDGGRTRVNLGRSLSTSGRHAEALIEFTHVRRGRAHRHWLRQALRHGAECLLALGRHAEVLDWVEDLRPVTTSAAIPDFIEGLARLGLGDAAGALVCFERIDELTDEDHTIPLHILQARRGLTLAAAGRWTEAAPELRAAVRAATTPSVVWGPLIEAEWRSRASMDELAAMIPDADLLHVLGHALSASAEAGDALAEALWRDHAKDARLLAFAQRRAPRLELRRALEWAARLRSAGLDVCPLVDRANDEQVDPVDRLAAAAVAFEVFNDVRARPALLSAARVVPQERFLQALSVVDELSPRLLGSVVSGAASTAGRSAAMAQVLRSVGAVEQAELVLVRATA